MARISVSTDLQLDAGYPAQRGARARIVFTDGGAVSGEIQNARGEPEVPASLEDVISKYQRLAGFALGEDTACLREMIADLERLSEPTTLGEVMARAVGNTRSWRTKMQGITA